MQDLTKCTDEELVVICKNDSDEAMDVLFLRYKQLIKKLSREYFLIGAETDDLIQEGQIGLFKAIRDYNLNKNVPFRSFARLCISRQLITAIKQSQRNKHQPLNDYVSLNYQLNGEDPLIESIENGILSPENLLISKEEFDKLTQKINSDLSKFEKKVLIKYLEGMSYNEISASLDCGNKAVDNALQRIKSKLH